VSLPITVRSNTGTIDISGIPSGLYVLEFFDQQGRSHQTRVVIAH
jgi:hypothetical protein